MIIRSMQPQELSLIVRIYVDTFKATHQGVVSDMFLSTLSYENALPRFAAIVEKKEHTPFCYVVQDGDAVIGYALAARTGDSPPLYQAYQGELKTMYILPAYHRMGLGRTLVHAVTRRFQQERVQSFFVGTFRDNYPARRFYEVLGGCLIEECQGEIRGEVCQLAAYGWESVSDLLQLLSS